MRIAEVILFFTAYISSFVTETAKYGRDVIYTFQVLTLYFVREISHFYLSFQTNHLDTLKHDSNSL